MGTPDDDSEERRRRRDRRRKDDERKRDDGEDQRRVPPASRTDDDGDGKKERYRDPSEDPKEDNRRKRREMGSDDEEEDDDSSAEKKHRRKMKRKRKRRKYESSESDDDDEASSEEDRRRSKGSRKKKKKKKKRSKYRKKKSKRRDDSSSDEDDTNDDDDDREAAAPKIVQNQRLLEKLAARGETLEEREARRAQRRAARITQRFGYTAEDNPFNDPNLHDTFTWKKKDNKSSAAGGGGASTKSRQTKQDSIFQEIEKVRQRRKDREMQMEEMERLRAEESRMKELENYDEWARKEEEFHLQQQRQRSAIRLIEGRETPIDVLAKNLLMFGLTDEERKNRAAVKYQERYNALNELGNLEAELQSPHDFLKVLKLVELEQLSADIEAFYQLEKQESARESTVVRYWESLQLVTKDEIEFLKAGGADGKHASTVAEVEKLFHGQSRPDLERMKLEVEDKLRKSAHAAAYGSTATDIEYWKLILQQLDVHMAKKELAEIHSKMLVCQLEQLEKKKVEMEEDKGRGDKVLEEDEKKEESAANVPPDVSRDFGNEEEEFGMAQEVETRVNSTYAWHDKFRPRKPRYFNRVKTGYDWNSYNKTHYDADNPPPKTVQGYKFNIFYPDLIDKTKTPQFFLEPAQSNEFCIIRFHAGPPYEDIAFMIINREWNRSRKNGYRCTFERGVLSLYFNFSTHWYRR